MYIDKHFTILDYSGPYILRPPVQAGKYSVKFEIEGYSYFFLAFKSPVTCDWS